jgi:hypothetical protein
VSTEDELLRGYGADLDNRMSVKLLEQQGTINDLRQVQRSLERAIAEGEERIIALRGAIGREVQRSTLPVLGWDELVLIARRMLDVSYPEAVFPDVKRVEGTGMTQGVMHALPLEGRDVGAQFIVHLRRALAVLPPNQQEDS